MSMMMPPDAGAAPGLPLPPGGGDGGPPPGLDALNQGPVPAEGGIGGLLAALGAGGGGAPPGDEPPGPPLGDATAGGTAPEDDQEMDAVEHIQQAMKHLMMAMAKESDEERGHGITKGMGALQGILAGEQKKNSQLQAIGG